MDLVTGPSGLHRNSPQELNISSIRVFDQVRDPEIPITLRPRIVYPENIPKINSNKLDQIDIFKKIFPVCSSYFHKSGSSVLGW